MKAALQPQPAAPAEHPIIFSGPMVRAILDGTKTQTRRIIRIPDVVRSEPEVGDGPADVNDLTSIGQREEDGAWRAWMTEYPDEGSVDIRCPYGKPGDRLWVRETWRAWERASDGLDHLWYQADDAKLPIPNTREAGDFVVGRFDRWRPSIHMPRWASRITLEVTDVRAERLQDISVEDIAAEGVAVDWGVPCPPNVNRKSWEEMARGKFGALWNSINGDRDHADWAANPWVWAVTFRVLP